MTKRNKINAKSAHFVELQYSELDKMCGVEYKETQFKKCIFLACSKF